MDFILELGRIACLMRVAVEFCMRFVGCSKWIVWCECTVNLFLILFILLHCIDLTRLSWAAFHVTQTLKLEKKNNTLLMDLLKTAFARIHIDNYTWMDEPFTKCKCTKDIINRQNNEPYERTMKEENDKTNEFTIEM